MNVLELFLRRTRIAHFSMEIALAPEMHTYSGGLGVLAGDTRSSADLDLPIAFVSLVSRAGYVRQEIDAEGGQVAEPDPWRRSNATKIAVIRRDRDRASERSWGAGRQARRRSLPLFHVIPSLDRP